MYVIQTLLVRDEVVDLKEKCDSDVGCVDRCGIICDFTVTRMTDTLASTSPFSADK